MLGRLSRISCRLPAIVVVAVALSAGAIGTYSYMESSKIGQDGDEGESDDGFECGLCLIDKPNGTITYAGARFELWRARAGEIEVIKGDKAGIGYRRTSSKLAFTNHAIDIRDGDAFYIVSDGIVDQVGGPRGRAFGKRRVREAILAGAGGRLGDVAGRIQNSFRIYQGEEQRRDDVTVVGFRP